MKSRDNLSPAVRVFCLSLLLATLIGLTWALPPMPQPPEYHRFADQRSCLGLPNCLDTASNAFFLLAGLTGLHFLLGPSARRAFIEPREALPYALFFFAAILIGLGSGWYHLAPDNGRLLWDRAAIALAFMAWLTAVLCERVGPRAGLRLLPLLVAAGLGSVAYWHLSEARGAGDLRLYGLVQITPMLLIPLLLLLIAAGLGSVAYWDWSEARGAGDLRLYGLVQATPLLLIPLLLRLYPPRYSGDRDLAVIIALYLLALLCDFGDRRIFALTGALVSGHTTKHLVAGLAGYWVVRRLQRRRIL